MDLTGVSSVTTSHVLNVIKKIVGQPSEIKFRRLRRTNPAFNKRFTDANGGLKLLDAIGFKCDPNDPAFIMLAEENIYTLISIVEALETSLLGPTASAMSSSTAEAAESERAMDTALVPPCSACTDPASSGLSGSKDEEEEEQEEEALAMALAMSTEACAEKDDDDKSEDGAGALARALAMSNETTGNTVDSLMDIDVADDGDNGDGEEAGDLERALKMSRLSPDAVDNDKAPRCTGEFDGDSDDGGSEDSEEEGGSGGEEVDAAALAEPSVEEVQAQLQERVEALFQEAMLAGPKAAPAAGTAEAAETVSTNSPCTADSAGSAAPPLNPNQVAASCLQQAQEELRVGAEARATARGALAAASSLRAQERAAAKARRQKGRLLILSKDGFEARVKTLFEEGLAATATAAASSSSSASLASPVALSSPPPEGASNAAESSNTGGSNTNNNAVLLQALAAAREEQLKAADLQAKRAARQRIKRDRASGATAAAAAAKQRGGAHISRGGDGSPPPSPVPLQRSTSSSVMAVPTFQRQGSIEAVAQEQLDVINDLYRTDGVQFVDDQFYPGDRSLYASTQTASTWLCRACSFKNPLPNGGKPHTRDELLRLMFPSQFPEEGQNAAAVAAAVDAALNAGGSSSGGGGGGQQPQPQARQQRTIVCGSCGHHSAELEVAMRPASWMKPAFVVDDQTLQPSTVPWKVFRGDPRPDDIRQGGVGNCWLVCALSVLAERPETIRRILLTRDLNPAGAYQVRLCRAGSWHTLTIDDSFPVNALSMLAYLKAARRSLWGPLIEKAAAKLHGSYEALAGGTFAEAFAMLTGYPVQRLLLHEYREPEDPKKQMQPPPTVPDSSIDPATAAMIASLTQEQGNSNGGGGGGGGGGAAAADDPYARRLAEWREEHGSQEERQQELFAQLYSFKQSGFAMGACTFISSSSAKAHEQEAQLRAVGLQVPHAYGILDVVELEPDEAVDCLPPSTGDAGNDGDDGGARGREKFGPLGGLPTLQLVKLRNPNGHGGWRGPWSFDAQGGRFHSSDKRWTRQRRQRLAVGEDDEGVFWMGWPEFCLHFAELTVCRLLEETTHLEARQMGWLASAFNAGEAVVLETFAHTRVELCAYQEAHATRGEEASRTLVDIGLAVLKCPTSSELAISNESSSSDDSADNLRLVAHASRSLHGEGCTASVTLEQDDYPSTRYLALPLCFAQMRSTEPRRFLLAVHSEAPLTVETVPVTARMLAHAVVNLCLAGAAKGSGSGGGGALTRRVPFLTNRFTNQDVLVFYVLQDDAGLVVVAENTSDSAVQVEVDASEHTKGYLSSRGGSGPNERQALVCQDVLPPRTRQLLMVLSLDASQRRQAMGYRVGGSSLTPQELGLLGTENGGFGNFQGSHIPGLEHLGELAKLHEALPIPAADRTAMRLTTPAPPTPQQQQRQQPSAADNAALLQMIQGMLSNVPQNNNGANGQSPPAPDPSP